MISGPEALGEAILRNTCRNASPAAFALRFEVQILCGHLDFFHKIAEAGLNPAGVAPFLAQYIRRREFDDLRSAKNLLAKNPLQGSQNFAFPVGRFPVIP